MGDAADFLLEALADAYDDEFGGLDNIEDAPSFMPQDIVCKYCKQTGLYWNRVEEKWRLFNIINGKIHVCPANLLKE